MPNSSRVMARRLRARAASDSRPPARASPLLQVAQQPGKLARGIGGTLLLSLSYVFCMVAFSRSLPIAKSGTLDSKRR